MINFRYHLVSLVAVFLALAIGIVAGSTVIKESILDQTQQNLDSAERNLKDLEDSNNKLKAELDQLKGRDGVLNADSVAQLLQDRLTSVPVLMIVVDGVDEHSASMVRSSIAAAGADVAGVVTLTDRLALTAPADVARLQELLNTTTLDPTALRAALAGRLATLITSVADSAPARFATQSADSRGTGAVTSTSSSAAVTTTTTAPRTASLLASDQLRQFLEDLDDDGFAKLSNQPDNAAAMDLGGVRLAVMSGGGAKVDNGAFVYPLLQRLGQGEAPATVAVEATPDGSTVGRGSFVGPIRDDGTLRTQVSTVDDAEWFMGWAAAVLALQNLDAGMVGHYGLGKGADRLLPTTTS